MTSPGRYSANSLRRFISSLNSIRFWDEIGEVEYFGQKVVMLSRDAFTLMRQELVKVGGGAANVILGIAGRRVGNEEGRALLAKAESLGMKTPNSFPEFVRVSVEDTNMGYGKMKVNELDAGSSTVTVSVSNSFEAVPAGRSQKASCVFMLSYLEGIFSQLLGKNIRGNEITCRGKDDEICMFRLAASLPV